MRTLVLLALVACAHGVEDPLPPPVDVPGETRAPTPSSPPSRVVCEVIRVDQRAGCDIYTLDCQGTREFAVICDTQPRGEITDPPRPVKP